MMRNIVTRNLVLGAVAVLATACSGADEEEQSSWTCSRVAVPMGATIECVSTSKSALLSMDGVSGDGLSGSGTAVTADGTSSGGSLSGTGTTFTADGTTVPTVGSIDGEVVSVVWDCAAGSTSPLCPSTSAVNIQGVAFEPAGAISGSTNDISGSGTGTGYPSAGSTSSGSTSGGTTSTGGTGSGTSGTGTGGGGTSGTGPAGAGSSTNGGTSGTGTDTSGSGTGTGTDTSGSGTSGNGNGNGNGGVNGNGPASAGSSSNGGAGGTSSDGYPAGGGISSNLVPECAYGPDLSYCNPATSSDGSATSGSGTGTGTGTGGTTTGTNGNGNGNGGTNGNGSNKPSAGGTTADGSGTGTGTNGNGNGPNGSNGNGNGNGKNIPSTSDGHGPIGENGGNGFSCISIGGVTKCSSKTPKCAVGTHPGSCGACVPNGAPESECQSTTQGGCWITGGGWVAAPEDNGGNGKATFGGNGKPMKSGVIQGEWNHVDHEGGGHIHGKVNYLVCRHVDEPGPGNPSGPKHNFNDNQAYFGGPARYSDPNGKWTDGYWFDAFVEDHGEPGNKPGPGNHGSKGPDEYHIVLRKQADPAAKASGTIVYEIHTAEPLGGGNIQLHPPNGGHPSTASAFPNWVSWEQ